MVTFDTVEFNIKKIVNKQQLGDFKLNQTVENSFFTEPIWPLYFQESANKNYRSHFNEIIEKVIQKFNKLLAVWSGLKFFKILL